MTTVGDLNADDAVRIRSRVKYLHEDVEIIYFRLEELGQLDLRGGSFFDTEVVALQESFGDLRNRLIAVQDDLSALHNILNMAERDLAKAEDVSYARAIPNS